MWIIIKIKKNNIEIFKNSLKEFTGEKVFFYQPKIQYDHLQINGKSKTIKKNILGNYIFCNHDFFKDLHFINRIKSLKGLDYVLLGHLNQQKDILRFINHCKKNENSKGYLQQTFFEKTIKDKAQFISGPFVNMIFEIISKQNNKLKIILNNRFLTLNKNSNYLYRSV